MYDREPTSAMSSQPATDASAYLQWKANGRPPCSRCRELHFGFCKTPQREIDFMNRDPKEYNRHRRRAKRQRRRRDQSATQHVSATQLLNFRQPDEQQSPHASSSAPHNTPLNSGQQREHQSTSVASDHVSSNFLRSMVDLYRETLPHDSIGLCDFTAACQQVRDTGVVDQTPAFEHPPTDYNAGPMSFALIANRHSGDWASGDG